MLGYDAVAIDLRGVAAHRLLGFQESSPLPAAGIHAGDLVVDPPRGRIRAGEKLTLKIAHRGRLREVTVRAAPKGMAVALETGLAAGLKLFALGLGSLS